MKTPLLRRVGAVALLPIAFTTAQAADLKWTATTPSASSAVTQPWETAANWSGGAVPTALDTINAPSPAPASGTVFASVGLHGDATVGAFNVTLVTPWSIVAETDSKLEVLGDFSRSGSNSLTLRNNGGKLDVKIDGNLTVNTALYFGAAGGPINSVTVLGNTVVNGAALNVTSTVPSSFVGGITLGNAGRIFANRYGTIDGGFSTAKLDSAVVTASDIYASDASNTTAVITINGGAGTSGSYSGKLIDQTAASVGIWSPSLKIVKEGQGTQELSWGGDISSKGTSYNGGTEINGGTLIISNTTGSGTGGGYVSVGAAGTLAGSGFITPTAGKNVTVAGAISPGKNGTGTLTLGLQGASQLVFLDGSKLQFTLGSSSDQIAFSTSGDWLAGSGKVTLALTLGAGFDYSQSYTIFDNVTTSGFQLAGVTGYDTSNYTAVFNRVGNDYQVSFAAVPEPAPGLLIALALVVVVSFRAFSRLGHE